MANAFFPLAFHWLTAIVGFYHNRDNGLNSLVDYKDCMSIQDSVGLFVNEKSFITSSGLIFESGAYCMKKDRTLRWVLCDLNKNAYCILNPTIHQHPDSMEELSEEDEKTSYKKQKLLRKLIHLPHNSHYNRHLQPTHKPL